MRIRILHCLAGARMASGTAVIIDVFRACNTVLSLLDAGANRILPVATLRETRALKGQGYLIGGERNGLMPVGFDFGNSPAEAAVMDLKGRAVVLTTSAGTRGIHAASRSREIILASFANLSAVCRYLLSGRRSDISLVAMGSKGRNPAEEDDSCALLIRDLLTGVKANRAAVVLSLRECEGARRLLRLGQHEDLEFCLRMDVSETVPVVHKRGNRWVITASSALHRSAAHPPIRQAHGS
jgi:2-phosphosulfolactate phosphatase